VVFEKYDSIPVIIAEIVKTIFRCMFIQELDGYMKITNTDKKIMDFVDEQRMSCLWYMPDNYYPANTARKLAVLRKIQSYGNLDAYKKAGKLICQLRNSKV
jgi:hypothetical protein